MNEIIIGQWEAQHYPLSRVKKYKLIDKKYGDD